MPSIFEQVASGLVLMARTAKAVQPVFSDLIATAAKAEKETSDSLSRIRKDAEATAASVSSVTGGGGDSPFGSLASNIETDTGR